MLRSMLSPKSDQNVFDLMDRFFTFDSPRAAESTYALPVDIWQKDSIIHVRAAVPGVRPEELDVRFEDGTLTLTGETRNEAVTDAKAQVWRREYSYGRFERSIRLPENAVADKIEASFENGFVTVSVPLQEEPRKAFRVPVKGISQSTAPSLEESAEVQDQRTNGSQREEAIAK